MACSVYHAISKLEIATIIKKLLERAYSSFIVLKKFSPIGPLS